MSVSVLLNKLNRLGERDKREACLAFYHFCATNLINSMLDSIYHI